jgi:hypothetical protein
MLELTTGTGTGPGIQCTKMKSTATSTGPGSNNIGYNAGRNRGGVTPGAIKRRVGTDRLDIMTAILRFIYMVI